MKVTGEIAARALVQSGDDLAESVERLAADQRDASQGQKNDHRHHDGILRHALTAVVLPRPLKKLSGRRARIEELFQHFLFVTDGR